MNDPVGMWMMIGLGIIIALIAWRSGHASGYAKGRESAQDDEMARQDGYNDRAHFLRCMKESRYTPEYIGHVRKNLENSKEHEARESAAGRLTPEQEERFRKENERVEKWLKDAQKKPYIWR
jgi:hypothetical protein